MSSLKVTLIVCFVQLIYCSRQSDEESLWSLVTDELPLDAGDLKLMPMLGNGNLGLNVFQPSLRKQCLYSGEGGATHRTRIPSYSNLRMYTNGRFQYKLNLKQGVFEETVSSENYDAKHSVLVHRVIPGLIINTVSVIPTSVASNSIHKINIDFTNVTDDSDQDLINVSNITSINLVKNELGLDVFSYFCARTQVRESPDQPPLAEDLCVGWTPPTSIIFTSEDGIITENFVTLISDSEQNLLTELDKVSNTSLEALLSDHYSAWKDIWDKGSILLDGDLNLGKTILASLFYIYSSLPMSTAVERFCGLSPGGISYGGNGKDYQGHSFWDTAIWMYPSILILHPSQGKELLNYRLDRLEAARDHASNGGWTGARFPWESALTGSEVCPDFAAETRENQIHISGDISFAARQYLAVTGDLDWFIKSEGEPSGCDLVYDVAEFWASRISVTEEGISEIVHVMGPDEDHGDVDNNVYTNIIAGYSVFFADFLSCAANCTSVPEDLVNKAMKLKLEYDVDEDYHPQYTGYKKGTEIKQADTVLLGYPLMYSMNASTRVNDLKNYGDVVRSDGPAMTWGMHAIGQLEVGNLLEAERFFNQSYQPYAREPFFIWTEQQEPNIGAVNFITGMGGFLQVLLFGHTGIRTRLDRMDLDPQLPPNSRGLEVRGISYYGAEIDLILSEDDVEIDFRSLEQGLILRQAGTEYMIDEPTMLQLDRKPLSLLPSQSGYLDNCNLPADSIGM